MCVRPAARSCALTHLQMDDHRLAAGCANGMVHLVDLRCLRTAKGSSGGASKPTALPAYTLLPAHRERVSWCWEWTGGGEVDKGLRGLASSQKRSPNLNVPPQSRLTAAGSPSLRLLQYVISTLLLAGVGAGAE